MTEPLFSIPMIERFIGYDTISRNSNLPLIHFVRDYLSELGVESVLTHDESGKKPISLPRSAPKIAPALFCPVTPMWCHAKIRNGQAIRSRWPSWMIVSWGAASAT